jgi:hypothetical protein
VNAETDRNGTYNISWHLVSDINILGKRCRLVGDTTANGRNEHEHDFEETGIEIIPNHLNKQNGLL